MVKFKSGDKVRLRKGLTAADMRRTGPSMGYLVRDRILRKRGRSFVVLKESYANTVSTMLRITVFYCELVSRAKQKCRYYLHPDWLVPVNEVVLEVDGE